MIQLLESFGYSDIKIINGYKRKREDNKRDKICRIMNCSELH